MPKKSFVWQKFALKESTTELSGSDERDWTEHGVRGRVGGDACRIGCFKPCFTDSALE
jgi:hypothetical protein